MENELCCSSNLILGIFIILQELAHFRCEHECPAGL